MQSNEAILTLRKVAFSAFQPDPKMTVSEWADAYRTLSEVSSPEPGRWKTYRTPYLREIMDQLSATSKATEVVFMKGSQIGGSEAGLNWIGYVIDHFPGPAMLVQPTELLAKRFVTQRLDRLLSDTERLHAKVREKKSRDKKNTSVMKEYDGGMLIISGANSAPSLRSMPIKILFLDEIDGYPHNVGKEGDPVKLAEARTRNFSHKKKVFKCSTPTIDGKSRIQAAFETSDRRYYLVPCPFCDFFQKITWASIRWEGGKPETAHMVCSHCDSKIEEFHKNSMFSRGKWVAENPESKVVGFHLSALYSPLGWYSWQTAVKEFLEAQGNEEKLIVFVNTVLGETWKVKGEAPEWGRLFERREHYKYSEVPRGGIFLTAGVDVQKDRFEVEIVAWGENKESWSVDYRVIPADTSKIEDYLPIQAILNETFACAWSKKVRLPISLMAIDSGYNTQAVYSFVRGKNGRVIAVKGSDTLSAIIGKPSPVDVSYAGLKIKKGVHVWPVGSSPGKSELYGWLGLIRTSDGPFPAGYCHFPQYDGEYFKMLTAEELQVKMVRGHPRYQWVKTRPRNEALDARIYARAAAAVVGLDRFHEHDWNERRSALMYNESETSDTPPKKEKRREKGGIPVKESDSDSFW